MKKNNDPKIKGKQTKVKKFKFPRLRGMKDILFDEYKYWNLLTSKAEELARVYGFKKVETPIMESMKLYENTTGKTSSIVSDELYTLIDRDGVKAALRPEATPGLVRLYMEHNMHNLPQPVKMFWMGPIFRNKNTQNFKFKQSHQFDLEVFGEENPVADVQLIQIAFNFFKELKIDAQVHINSIGCKECRKGYLDKLISFYKERGKRAKLCANCKKLFGKNPFLLLDCQEEPCKEVREGAPQIVDSLCDPCREHFIKVLEYLDDLSVPYNLSPYLVRGLDYYSKTVFEIFSISEHEDNSNQLALGGGGRYDELIESLGGKPTPAVGFAIDLERTIIKIKEKGVPLKDKSLGDIFIAQLGDAARRQAMVLFEELRKSGFNARQSFAKDSLRDQLEDASRSGAKISLILGQKELNEGTILIRDMDSGIQEVIDYKKIQEEIRKRFKKDEE